MMSSPPAYLDLRRPVCGHFICNGSAPPALARLSPMIGPSGKPSDDDDNDDPAGKLCLPAVHHGIFDVLVVPTCLRHRLNRFRPPEMPLSKLV